MEDGKYELFFGIEGGALNAKGTLWVKDGKGILIYKKHSVPVDLEKVRPVEGDKWLCRLLGSIPDPEVHGQKEDFLRIRGPWQE